MLNDEQELKIREERKKKLVEEEIENHPLFKTLKNVAANANINLMVETIVDRYFEFSSGNANNYENKDYFEVSSTFIQMALDQTIYLINFAENGVVLDSNGLQNEAKSNEQKFNASYGALKQEFAEALEAGESFEYNNKENVKQINEFARSNKIELVLDNLEKMSIEELNDYFCTKEGKEAKAKVLDNEQAKEEIADSREDSNLEKADNVTVMSLCLEINAILTKRKITEFDREIIIDKMKELDRMGPEATKGLKNDRGKTDIRKVLEYYQKFSRAYTNKENLKVLKSFGRKDFQTLTDAGKLKVLEAALALYIQPGGKYKNKALIAFASIEGLTTKDANGRLVLNGHAFTKLYNSARNENNMSFEKIVETVIESQRAMVEEQIEMLNGQVKDGSFQERSKEDLQSGKEAEEKGTDDVLAANVTGQSQETELFGITQKMPLGEKINKRLRQNYRKAKYAEVDKKLEKFYGDLPAEARIAAIVNVYRQSKKAQDESKQERWETKFIEEYILSHPTVFGDIIDGKKVNLRRAINYYTNENREIAENKVVLDDIEDIFNEVARKPKTLGLLLKGSFEAFKDVSQSLERKVEATTVGYYLTRNLSYFLPGRTGVGQNLEYKYDNEVLNSITNDFEGERIFKDEEDFTIPKLDESEKKEKEKARRNREKRRNARALKKLKAQMKADEKKQKAEEKAEKKRQDNEEKAEKKKQKEENKREKQAKKLTKAKESQTNSTMSQFESDIVVTPDNLQPNVNAQNNMAKEAELREKWSAILEKHGMSPEQMEGKTTAQLGKAVEKIGGKEIVKEAKQDLKEANAMGITQTGGKTVRNEDDGQR